MASQKQLIEWINHAGMAEGVKKADLIRKISEVIIHQTPQYIPNYLENILSFANNKSTEVKKQVIAFIEELSKNHPQYLPKTVYNLVGLLCDNVIAVQKRVIQASSITYRHMLQWLGKSQASIKEKQSVWDHMNQLKIQILNMIDSDNEGIRTHSIKFLEEIVLLQTPRDGRPSDNDEYALEDITINIPFINKKALEEESEHIFNLLLKFHNSQHISSVNLMACMTSVCSLAKYRPRYMVRVMQALGDLHTTLPPTLSQSQVNSVRKHLKMILINLAKHPSSSDCLPTLTQLLLDLGMSNQEINKILPKERRQKRHGENKADVPSKKPRIEPYTPMPIKAPTNIAAQVPDEGYKRPVTEDSLYDGINNIEKVVSLVTSTLLNQLPTAIPPNFTSIYKPVANAGTPHQKRQLARMMLALIKGETIPSVPTQTPQTSLAAIAAKIPNVKENDEKATLRNAVAKLQESTKADRQMESAVTKLMEETRQEHLKEEARKTKNQEKPVPPPTPTIPKLKHRVKLLKLQEITVPLPKETKQKLVLQAVTRILRAENDAAIGGATLIRNKLITIFASSYTPELRDLVLNYILDDAMNRTELAISWLYEEYSFMQGFNRHPITLQPRLHEKHDHNYNQLLCALITQICERGDPNTENAKDVLLRKIYLEAPHITDEAIDYLKYLVTDDKMTIVAMELLEEICIMRPPRSHKYVTAILSHVLNESEHIRDMAVNSVVKIYKISPDPAKKVIEKYAKLYLGFISLNSPPVDLFMGDTRIKHKWTDDLFKLCINLIMALFPENEELIVEVGRVYGLARAEAKRVVLRAVETPVRAARGGPPRAALLRLLDACPRGAETLLTRLVHLLTEREPPSPELVSRVRELYATRVSDVRFLIPVLNGLTKKEILAALPKLIKLNPVVVKEVFNKLLGLHNVGEEHLPISPAELLVALHLIDPGSAELKYTIKATALCFAEKQTYTQEVVSKVLEQLVELDEIPLLMMRSVLQALTLYPALSGLVLNLLSRLIEKEVWSNKVAWEGWVKCCERTAPASVPVVLRLPAGPLRAAVQGSAAVAAALRAHVAALPPPQRAALPDHLLTALTPPPSTQPGPEHQPMDIMSQYMAPPGTNSMQPLPPGME